MSEVVTMDQYLSDMQIWGEMFLLHILVHSWELL